MVKMAQSIIQETVNAFDVEVSLVQCDFNTSGYDLASVHVYSWTTLTVIFSHIVGNLDMLLFNHVHCWMKSFLRANRRG